MDKQSFFKVKISWFLDAQWTLRNTEKVEIVETDEKSPK